MISAHSQALRPQSPAQAVFGETQSRCSARQEESAALRKVEATSWLVSNEHVFSCCWRDTLRKCRRTTRSTSRGKESQEAMVDAGHVFHLSGLLHRSFSTQRVCFRHQYLLLFACRSKSHLSETYTLPSVPSDRSHGSAVGEQPQLVTASISIRLSHLWSVLKVKISLEAFVLVKEHLNASGMIYNGNIESTSAWPSTALRVTPLCTIFGMRECFILKSSRVFLHFRTYKKLS